jgi:Leucine-rich repeat (LRR) protein
MKSKTNSIGALKTTKTISIMKKFMFFTLSSLFVCTFNSCEKILEKSQKEEDKDVISKISDPVFKVYINEQMWKLDLNYDGKLSPDEAEGLTVIDIQYYQIASLAGIEYFPNLTHLYCNNNKLTSIDMSKNTALIWLDCNNNRLTSLNVSKNTALKYLRCDDNQLTSLDISKNTDLTDLWCSGNQLASLDISRNTALDVLHCDDNQLTSLDISKNRDLIGLSSWSDNPGDGVSRFPVKAWFDNNSVPYNTVWKYDWTWNGKTITPYYYTND